MKDSHIEGGVHLIRNDELAKSKYGGAGRMIKPGN